MTDTPEHIRKKQSGIWLAKSPQERVRLGAAMIDEAFEITRFVIKREKPEFSDRDLKIQVFLRFYKDDFSEEELQRIIARF